MFNTAMSGETIDEEFVRVHAIPKQHDPEWRELLVDLKSGQSAWRAFPGYENDPLWGPKRLRYEIMPTGTVICSELAQCGASSWPFTVNDSRCVRDAHHKGVHRDVDGFEWGGDD